MKANKIKILLAIVSTLLLGAILLAGCYVYLEYDPPDPSYVPVQSIDIYGVPFGAVKNSTMPLQPSVYPANATNQNITWSMLNDLGTGASFDMNVLKIPYSLVVLSEPNDKITVRATIAGGGATRSEDYSQDFEIKIYSSFYKVSDITNVPTECPEGEDLTLPSGTDPGVVTPFNATNKTIIWSIKSAGGTGAVITGGNVLLATTAGTVVITATVRDGKAPDEDYTKDFTIIVKPPIPVVYVVGKVPDDSVNEAACYWEVDTYTNNKTLHILETSYQSGAYGAVFESGTLYVAGIYYTDVRNVCLWVVHKGVVTRRHIDDDAWTLDEYGGNTIALSNGKVYIVGTFTGESWYEPVYWEWDPDTHITKRVPLPYPAETNPANVYTTGIAVSGSTVYVSGNSNTWDTDESCYWTSNGTTSTYHKLSGVDEAEYTKDIAVMDGDVYIASDIDGRYWINGTYYDTWVWGEGWEYHGLPVPTVTPAIGDFWTAFNGITARDGKWYVVGRYVYYGHPQTCYWENGQYRELDNGGSDYIVTRAIAVQQGTVYIAGRDDDYGTPIYWVNGGMYETLPLDGKSWGEVSGIAVGWKK